MKSASRISLGFEDNGWLFSISIANAKGRPRVYRAGGRKSVWCQKLHQSMIWRISLSPSPASFTNRLALSMASSFDFA
jgi:hypothetical protein